MYNKIEKDTECMKQIKGLREAASLFPNIRKVVERFDGKCYNCRFDKAIKDIGPGIWVEKTKYYFRIYTYNHRYHGLTLAQISLDDMPDGKRIPAELLVKSLKGRRESMLREACEIEESMKHVEEIESQVNQIESLLSSVYKNIPSFVLDTYKLRYRMQAF